MRLRFISVPYVTSEVSWFFVIHFHPYFHCQNWSPWVDFQPVCGAWCNKVVRYPSILFLGSNYDFLDQTTVEKLRWRVAQMELLLPENKNKRNLHSDTPGTNDHRKSGKLHRLSPQKHITFPPFEVSFCFSLSTVRYLCIAGWVQNISWSAEVRDFYQSRPKFCNNSDMLLGKIFLEDVHQNPSSNYENNVFAF